MSFVAFSTCTPSRFTRPRCRRARAGRLLSVVLLAFALARAAAQLPSAPSPRPEAVKPRLDLTERSGSATLDEAEAAIQRQNDAAAIELLRPFLRHFPDSWRGHYDLGYALSRVRNGGASLQSNLALSIGELARSLQLNQANADAHKILALDLTMIQRDDLAGKEFAEAVRLAPSSAENHYFLGRYRMRHGDYVNAALELRKATELDPGSKKAFQNLGIALEQTGQKDEALRCLRQAVELDSRDSKHAEEPYLDLANFYRRNGNVAAAVPLARKATEINPTSEESFLQLALAYRAQQDWPQALTALQKAVALNPHQASTQYLLGRTLQALGEREQSEQAFAAADRMRKQQTAVAADGTQSR